jgi:glutaconate CoA-transferase subunit B
MNQVRSGTAPTVLSLSIGDGDLCEMSVTTASVPEMFRYWLQGGRLTIGFLGAVQFDKFGNINTTVIGGYEKPKTRLPGGGAPEIASSCGEIYITMAQSTRGMVDKIDFVTSFGHREGGDHRERLGIATKGSTLLIKNLATWRSDLVTREFTVMSLHPGVTREKVQETCAWKVKFAEDLDVTPAPSELELKTLRDLKAITDAAHKGESSTPAAPPLPQHSTATIAEQSLRHRRSEGVTALIIR